MSLNNRSNISENAQRLEVAVQASLTVNGVPTEEQVLELASALRKISLYLVTDDEFSDVIRRLHEALTIDMGIGVCVEDNSDPWIQARKSEIIPFYWSRYKKDLIKQGLPPKVVDSLDRVTDEILDRTGNPIAESSWSKRGLVMGDVQSGKTLNYTGLICKAADAGYKLVIVLTGTLESLRRQTQSRLDSGFVGLDSSGVVNRNRRRLEIGAGSIDGTRTAGVFTSTESDFNASTVNGLGFKLRDYREPVLLVVKKNKNIIKNLTDWLIAFNANKAGFINSPLLLIDDEADNASVNTKKEDVTAINSGIRSLLKVFPKNSYVGFTATPFANVFIHPDTTNEMISDDLFPRDFIYALDAPTNYIGAQKIFQESNNSLIYINDADLHFQKKQKKDDRIDDVPNSLIVAMENFIIINAIMDLRTGCTKHRSMLVNVTHLTLIQNQVRDILDSVLRKIQEDIQNYSMLKTEEALKNSTINSLYEIFNSKYSNFGFDWYEVQNKLNYSTQPIQVQSVNQGAGAINYSLYKEHGLRIIAVGGNSLARGLTLEGLSVSYFYRRTNMYDALLQMGRWFGYRTGYEDLFRIWITEDTVGWYSLVAQASDELRESIRRMQVSRLKPKDVGLKIRSHPDSLLITARNKMRNSEEVVLSTSINNELKETTRLLSNSSDVLSNFNTAKQFVCNLAGHTSCDNVTDYKFPFYMDIKKQLIVDFLKQYISHPLDMGFQSMALATFIENVSDSRLDGWDVAIPSGSISEELMSGVSIRMRERTVLEHKESKSLFVGGKNRRVGDAKDEKIGISIDDIDLAEKEFWNSLNSKGKKSIPGYAYRSKRVKPLLLIHFLKPIVEDSKKNSTSYVLPKKCGALVAVGLILPEVKTNGTDFIYRINLVELRNLMPSEFEYESEINDGEYVDA